MIIYNCKIINVIIHSNVNLSVIKQKETRLNFGLSKQDVVDHASNKFH